MAGVMVIAVLFWGGALVIVLLGNQFIRYCAGRFKPKEKGDSGSAEPLA